MSDEHMNANKYLKGRFINIGNIITDTTNNWQFKVEMEQTNNDSCFADTISVLTFLNELAEENESLKQFQTNVFTLINEMIETANFYRTPIKTLDYGDDLGYWNGVYQKLKELRDILENEETRK